MRLPILHGLIRRRLLVNFRVDAPVRTLAVEQVESSFFADALMFPAGCVVFDHALVMRDLPHRWHEEADLFTERSADKSAQAAGHPTLCTDYPVIG